MVNVTVAMSMPESRALRDTYVEANCRFDSLEKDWKATPLRKGYTDFILITFLEMKLKNREAKSTFSLMLSLLKKKIRPPRNFC